MPHLKPRCEAHNQSPAAMIGILLLLIFSFLVAVTIVQHQAAVRRRDEFVSPRSPAGPVVPELHTVRFLRLPFGTFVKLSVLLAAAFGLVVGVLFSFAGLCGARVYINLFSSPLRGEEAIIAAPFLGPVFAVLVVLVLDPFVWLLLNWLLRRTRGVDVTGTIANLPEEPPVTAVR